MKETDENDLTQLTFDFYEYDLEKYFFLHDWLKMRPDERLEAIEKVNRIKIKKET